MDKDENVAMEEDRVSIFLILFYLIVSLLFVLLMTDIQYVILRHGIFLICFFLPPPRPFFQFV